jgi:hypothetical protein
VRELCAAIACARVYGVRGMGGMWMALRCCVHRSSLCCRLLQLGLTLSPGREAAVVRFGFIMLYSSQRAHVAVAVCSCHRPSYECIPPVSPLFPHPPLFNLRF